MPLSPGQQLSVYEILEPIGAGAMGEVYRARDTRLERDVAIKTLPEHFAEDEDRLRRFEREARSLASLNHPNVAQIFGVDQVGDTCFLVLELVEGESLDDRLRRGPLSVRDAMDVGRQIAEGLEAAHEAGVVHRDLKPANVRITPEGKVKVLDFGLAKPVLQGEQGSGTDSVLATEAGRVLGTPTYMAPEQARGRPIDRRVDVWAYGCVLFEALTGQRAFAGESLTDVLAAVLEREPDWTHLPAGVPPRVRRLLERCLTKEPRERLRDVGDARLELADALARPGEQVEATTARRSSGGLAWCVAAGASAIAIWLGFGGGSAPSPADERARRLSLELPPDTTVLLPGNAALDLSDDGRWVVFYGVEGTAPGGGGRFEDQNAQLYVRELGNFGCTPLPGTELATNPFFSPDAEWIAFFDSGAGRLRKVPRSGGAVIDLCACPEGSRGGDWGEDGTIVFSLGVSGGLHTVSEDGGEVTALAIPDWSKGDKSYRHPAFLPGGEQLLATCSTLTLASYDDAEIVRITLETGEIETLLRGGATPRYLASGHLLFGRSGALHAVALDPETGRTSGAPFVIQDGVMTSDSHGTAQYAVSNDGTLVYLPGGPEQAYTEYVWLAPGGAAGEPIGLEPGEQFECAASLDGTRLAIHTGGGNDFIQVFDVQRGLSTRLITGRGDSLWPVWSADGEHVIFSSNQSGSYDIYWQRADGSEPPRLLLESEHDVWATSTTRDGTLVVYEQLDLAKGSEVLMLPLGPGGRAGDPIPLLTESYNEFSGAVSPDGRWLAYGSDETGHAEIYVRPFPEGARRWQVSRSGGFEPRWSSDGSRLRYVGNEGLLEVDLSSGPGAAGDERLLQAWEDWRWLRVIESPEGERILGMRPIEGGRPDRIHVVLDLASELDPERR